MDKLGMDRGLYAQKLMNDLYRVGGEKAIGFLPTSTITDICKKDIVELEIEFKNKGLATMQRHKGDGGRVGNAFVVYDPQALNEILQSSATLRMLENYGWPTEAAAFVERVTREEVLSDSPLYDLIADCFGDKENPFRSSNRRPSY